jgi:hypothetical protein
MWIRRGTVRSYLEGLRDTAAMPGATEHTYREPLVRFLHAAAKDLELGEVTVHGELRLADVGQPDLQVVNADGAAIGYGETKVPGTATDFARVMESEQIARYRASIDNLLITDFLRFTLLRPEVGRLDATLVETPGRLAAGAYAVSQPALAVLSDVLASFFSARAPAATSAEQLADGLARRATLLRDAIRTLLMPVRKDDPAHDEGEALRRLWEFYRQSLMSDMSADDFADTYAQTLTYALFLARLESGPIRDLESAWRAIPVDVPILRSAIEPLRAAGRLPEAVSVWLTDSLHLLADTPNEIIASIGHPREGKPDPILYFYEHFLAAYDSVERIAKGVYYTPRPLVDYLVRAVNETLKSTFGKQLGLADKDVRLLDPALGTGTFLLAAAQTAVDEVATVLGPGAIRTVLEDQVLPHFFGFELLPAPYTISHLKLALFAREHHVAFTKKRAQVYLTNTLGDPVARADDGGILAFFVPGLIEEAAAAERVKSDEKILVVLGNPPWSATSHNNQPEIERLFAAWKTIDGRPGSPTIGDARIALNDDYLKFLRWAVWKVVEQPEGARHGIVAFVTNHGFINGRIHRGIRKALLDAFDEIWVFNAHGNRRLAVRTVPDDNVFPPVKQGVALTVLVRKEFEHAGPATVHYREMRGTREAKYRAAEQLRLTDEGWTKVAPEAPYWSFAPNDADSPYDTWPSVPEIFPTSTSGVQSSHDDLVSDSSAGPIADRMRQIEDRRIPDEVFEERFKISRNPRWVWSAHRSAFRGFDETKIIPWLYRLFDRRYIYWDPVFVEWPRLKVMRHLLPRPFGYGGEHRLALVVQRAGPKPTDALCTVTRGIACAHVTSQWNHVYPFRLADAVEEGHLPFGSDQWAENLDTDFAAALARSFGRRPAVEEVAWYAFGVLSAPSYRRDFAAALAIDHPRVPFPTGVASFDRMVELGRRLGAAHLLECPVPDDLRFVGEGSGIVERIRHDPDVGTVWINVSQRFTGVPLDAWTWGQGFRPLEHFLTDRKGRPLDADQVAMFQGAVTAVRASLDLAPQLDAALSEILVDTLAPTWHAATPTRLGPWSDGGERE